MNTVETTAATPEQVAKATIRLEFPHGVANLTIRADESMSDAYRGEFYGPKPTVTHADGVISIDYPRFNPFMGRTPATVTGQLIPRIKHYHYLGTIGVALMMVGIYLLAQTTAASTQMSVTIDIVMVGLGLGATMPLYINAVQSALPQRYLGVGTSQIQFWRNVGGTVSSAVLGSILAQRLPGAIASEIAKLHLPAAFTSVLGKSAGNPNQLLDPAQIAATKAKLPTQLAPLYDQAMHAVRNALALTLHDLFLIAIALSAIALIATLFMPDVPLRSRQPQPQVGIGEAPEREVAVG